MSDSEEPDAPISFESAHKGLKSNDKLDLIGDFLEGISNVLRLGGQIFEEFFNEKNKED